MYTNNEPVYLIKESSLRELLQETIRIEFKTLESRLEKKSRIMTREDAASKLGVCPNTISEYIKSGRLTNRGIGRKILILESDLEGVKPNRYTRYNN